MTAWGGRIHLRTVFSFVITAAALVWVNVLIREAEVLRLFQDTVLYGYGWPVFSIEGFPRAVPAESGFGIYFIEEWKFTGFVINMATATLILTTVTVFSEFVARNAQQLKETE
jgi:hypothetical protein